MQKVQAYEKVPIYRKARDIFRDSHVLGAAMDMELHPDKCFIFPASQGINFVGYIIKPWRRYARNMTVASAKNIADQDLGERTTASLNSYLGILKHADSYKLRK